MRHLLTRLSHEERCEHSARIVRHLVEGLPEVRTLATFAALPGEPELALLHQLLPNVRLLYPLVVGSSLSFHEVGDPLTLGSGSFGIREPVVGMHQEVGPAEIDALLCPGLAFDRHGGRLGRGKGFYDRVLSLMRPDALRVGVAFQLQIQEALPLEEHDILMTHLVREEEFCSI